MSDTEEGFFIVAASAGIALAILLGAAWVSEAWTKPCEPVCAPYAVKSALFGRCECDMTTVVREKRE